MILKTNKKRTQKNHSSQQNKLVTQVMKPKKPYKTHTKINYEP